MMAEPAKKVSGNKPEEIGVDLSDSKVHLTLKFGDGYSSSLETGIILAEVSQERERQVTKGYDAAHDDSHGTSTLIHNGYERFRMLGSYPADNQRRKALIQLAAMVVAEIERHDRAVGAKAIEL